MDLSMTATGACQTPLEGNALASGCSGCDGKAVYATITQFITGKEWFDNFEGLLMEDVTITAGTATPVKVYAYGGSMAAKELNVVAAETNKFDAIIKEGSNVVSADGEITIATAGEHTLELIAAGGKLKGTQKVTVA